MNTKAPTSVRITDCKKYKRAVTDPDEKEDGRILLKNKNSVPCEKRVYAP